MEPGGPVRQDARRRLFVVVAVGAVVGCALFGAWMVWRGERPAPPPASGPGTPPPVGSTTVPSTTMALIAPTTSTVRPSRPSPDAVAAAPSPQPATPGAVAPSPAPATTEPVATAPPAPASSSSPVAAASPSPPPTSARAADLSRRIGDILRETVGDGSAVVMTEVDGVPVTVRHAADVRRVAASTIKLPILLEVLREAERGEIDLGRPYTIRSSDVVGGTGALQGQVGRTLTYDELTRLMIVASDNVATNVLLRHLGHGEAPAGMARVNRLMTELGFRSTRVERTMLDTAAQQRGQENYVGAEDLATILHSVGRGAMLADISPAISRRALALLRERGAADRDWLGLRLDRGWSLAHINGTLDTVRNDAGIITGPGGREAILVICQDKLANPARGEQQIAEAAERIQELLNRD